MPTVPAGIIIAWGGTAASIPTGWSRTAALDGRYLRGAPASVDPYGSGGPNPGIQGGAANHAHAIPAHDHGSGDHTHVAADAANLNATGLTDFAVVGGTTTFVGDHAHTGGPTTSSGLGLATPAGTWSIAANDPLYRDVIWIQSDGTPTGLPSNALALWAQQQLPAGWTAPATYAYRFLRGAVTGADASATGGLAAHTHTETHTHPISHAHGDAVSGPPSSAEGPYSTASGTVRNAVGVGHTHRLTPAAATSATAAATPSGTAGSTTAPPPNMLLTVAQNASGSGSFPAYIVAIWMGALSAIPAGWLLCDGTGGTPDLRSQFVQGAGLLQEAGTTGGMVSHAHGDAASGHTHDATHSHGQGSWAFAVASGVQVGSFVNQNVTVEGSHGHGSVTSTTSAAAGSTNAVPTATSPNDPTQVGQESRPPFTDVAFVLYVGTLTPQITAPTAGQVLTLPNPVVTWTFPDLRIQVDYRVQVLDGSGLFVIYDSGTVVSAAQSAAIPAGYFQDSTSYVVRVTVTDSGHQKATSALQNFATSWVSPPTPSGISVTPVGGS